MRFDYCGSKWSNVSFRSDLIDEKSTLVQIMAWCRQAASHYLSQCWPRFMLPYAHDAVTRPQSVNVKFVGNGFVPSGFYIQKFGSVLGLFLFCFATNKIKIILWSSYFHNGNSCSNKSASLFWHRSWSPSPCMGTVLFFAAVGPARQSVHLKRPVDCICGEILFGNEVLLNQRAVACSITVNQTPGPQCGSGHNRIGAASYCWGRLWCESARRFYVTGCYWYPANWVFYMLELFAVWRKKWLLTYMMY